MDKNTLDKIQNEKALDWQESAALDAALESQSYVKGLMASIDDPEPSMAWRSGLNQQLREVAAKRKRRTLVPWFGGLAAAAACATALVVVVSRNTVHKSGVTPPQSFEAALAKAYTQSAESVPTEDEIAQNFDVTDGL